MKKTIIISPAEVNSSSPRVSKILKNEFKTNCSGKSIAEKLKEGQVECSDFFSYISGNYFRSKLSYANEFGDRQFILYYEGLLKPSDTLNQSLINRYLDRNIKTDAELKTNIKTLLINQISDFGLDRDEIIFLGSNKYIPILQPAFRIIRYPKQMEGKGKTKTPYILTSSVKGKSELEYFDYC